MSPITKEFTKERVAEIIHAAGLEPCDYEEVFGSIKTGEIVAMARIALASLEAEPVAWLLSGGGAKNNVSFDSGNAYADPLREVTPLYTAHPAPVSVPAAMEMDDDFDSAFEHGKAVGWNAYRAAMLQGAENAESRCTIKTAPALDSLTKNAESRCGNSPVIQGGWVACSERMPEDGEKVLTSFRGWMRTAVCKVVDVLGHKIFVDELTLFNGVPADHWQPLPAAPQQEVTQALAKGMERYGDAMQKLADSGD